MKRSIIFTFLCISALTIDAVANNVFVKGNVRGIIKDLKTGEPIQGATVILADLKVGSNTNAKGEYFFQM